jgi:DNA-binding NarL/FixJ family response regulator
VTSARAISTTRGQPLTPAETRVARLVARALKNSEIARELGVSEATVGVHLGRVYKKLGLRSRTELAVRLARTSEDEP